MKTPFQDSGNEFEDFYTVDAEHNIDLSLTMLNHSGLREWTQSQEPEHIRPIIGRIIENLRGE